MKKLKWIKKGISALLSLNMVLLSVPIPAFATETDLCEHHAVHTAECHYAEAVEGQPCTHEHSEDCYAIVVCIHEHDESCGTGGADCTHECTVDNGCIIMELDCHHIHGDCGWSEGTAEVPCGHSHDESCGYVAGIEGKSCLHSCADHGCTLNEDGETYTCLHAEHDEVCGHTASIEGKPCSHTVCDDTCGYAPATEGAPCTHECEILVDDENSCYKLLAPTQGKISMTRPAAI